MTTDGSLGVHVTLISPFSKSLDLLTINVDDILTDGAVKIN